MWRTSVELILLFCLPRAACPEFYYGSMCSEQCDCHPTYSLGCDIVDGTCKCKPGYEGERCQNGERREKRENIYPLRIAVMTILEIIHDVYSFMQILEDRSKVKIHFLHMIPGLYICCNSVSSELTGIWRRKQCKMNTWSLNWQQFEEW